MYVYLFIFWCSILPLRETWAFLPLRETWEFLPFFLLQDFSSIITIHSGNNLNKMKTSWFYKFIPQHKNQPCKFCPHKIGKTLVSAFDKLNYCWECDYRQLLVCHCYEGARSTSTELICHLFALCTVHFCMRIKQ